MKRNEKIGGDHDIKTMLKNTLTGNLSGIVYDQVASDEVFSTLASSNILFSTVVGIPQLSSEKEEVDIQTIENISNILGNHKFYLVIVWEHLDHSDLSNMENKINNIYNAILPHIQTQHGEQEIHDKNEKIHPKLLQRLI